MKRDYDTSLGRMAGNIAAGLASEIDTQRRLLTRSVDSSNLRQLIADVSIDIAKRIIVECKIEQHDAGTL